MDLEKRMEELEKTVQRHRRNQFILVGCLAVVLIAWAIWPMPKTIVAEQFILRDASGNIRSMWGMDENDPFLNIWGESQKRVVSIGMTEEGAGLHVADENGKKRFFAGTGREKSTGKEFPELGLLDESSKLRAWILVKGEIQSVGFRDSAGKIRGEWSIDAEGPFLNMWGPTQKRVMSLNLRKKGTGLFVVDGKGNKRFFTGTDREESTGEESPGIWLDDEKNKNKVGAVFMSRKGIPGLALYDSTDKERITLALPKNEEPAIVFRDKKGNVTWKVQKDSKQEAREK